MMDPNIQVASDGSTWALRCTCGRHPKDGHDATPITPPTTGIKQMADQMLAEDRRRFRSGAYSDASTARPTQEEAVPASHAGTAGYEAAVRPQNEG